RAGGFSIDPNHLLAVTALPSIRRAAWPGLSCVLCFCRRIGSIRSIQGDGRGDSVMLAAFAHVAAQYERYRRPGAGGGCCVAECNWKRFLIYFNRSKCVSRGPCQQWGGQVRPAIAAALSSLKESCPWPCRPEIVSPAACRHRPA